jgi:rod shape determining protein RodA
MTYPSLPLGRLVPTAGVSPLREREARALPALGRRLSVVDPLLLTAVLGLCGFGSLLVYAATRAQGAERHHDHLIYRHLATAVGGLVVAAVVAGTDYRRLRVFAPIAYLLALIGLVAVRTPLGVTLNGSHSWIVIGGMSVQPVEFAKLALVLGLALLLAERRENTIRTRPGHTEVFSALGLAVVPIALVLAQPDLGSVMVLVAVVAGVLVVAAVPVRWIIGLAVTATAGAVVVVQAHLLSQYQIDRFAAFTNPGLDPTGLGYNAHQARIAVASGGLTGAGLFHGSQTVGQFVPEQHTDFIFTVAGEQLGLLGAGAIVVAFAVLLWRGCVITRRAPDLFGSLVCTGVVCWFAFQAFENIGMALGLMPITGLPLPFVSYGGTAMMANLIGVGLLLNVHANSRTHG